MCITPLSIVTAFSNLEDRAVIRAGQFSLELFSGKIALGSFFLILFINSISDFSIKKTIFLPFNVCLPARSIKF